MPLYRVRCPSCGWGGARIRATAASALEEGCADCGCEVRREAKGPTAAKMEKLDNGAMARPVERFADAERMYAERAKNSDPLAGGAQSVKADVG